MNAPTTPGELLAQMVSFDTVNRNFGGRPEGEAALAEHLEKLAQGWGLRARRCPVGAGSGRTNSAPTHLRGRSRTASGSGF